MPAQGSDCSGAVGRLPRRRLEDLGTAVGIAVAGHIIGEVHIVDCIKVAERADGSLVEVAGNEDCFPLLPANLPRHRVDNFRAFQWRYWHAWVTSRALCRAGRLPAQERRREVGQARQCG